jgi:hypothetical protein
MDAAQEETPCPRRQDQQHCNCWYDGEGCCACGAGSLNRSRNCAAGEHRHCSGIYKTAGDDNLDLTYTCRCACHAAPTTEG